MHFELSDLTTKLPGVGSRSASLLKKLGINTLEDLLYHFPFRYEDLSSQKKIASLVPNEMVSLEASIWQVKTTRLFSGKFLTTAVLADETGTIEATWFNQPYLKANLIRFEKIVIAGKPTFYKGKLTFLAPAYEASGREVLHTRGLIPIYAETAGLNSKWLRTKIKLVLETVANDLAETLPAKTVKEEGFPTKAEALQHIHFPANPEQAKKARERFAFEELLLLQLASLKRKKELETVRVHHKLLLDKGKLRKFVLDLPFKLTKSQIDVTEEIALDLARARPMNRLLQGDVGSGKTIVAAIASFIVHTNGLKSLFMAPTEILANQHFETINKFFENLPLSVGLVTANKRVNLEADLLVGTHALLNLNLPKEKIGLIIVDEQHRFGVEQRSGLRKKGLDAHLLTLSATPIPRSLALIFFGELDVSVLKDLPLGRRLPKTFLVLAEKRGRAYEFIKKHIAEGERAFIICPFIEPSETLESVKSVKMEWEYLSGEVFPANKLGLLHGSLSPKEKEVVLNKFRQGEYQILVSTPIVEVGIDIPEATIILIEAAERFGLASLHQLRGRVGRGQNQSYCLLFTESTNPLVLKRLKNMERLTNGFDLAEVDLAGRGPGEIFGTLQHGLPDLKIASLGDQNLIYKTHALAERILANGTFLNENPLLAQNLQKKLRTEKLD
ncbi:MAG: hypothetical protein A3F35_02830 [Candidatus Woykebacteria bacterium RIFCSPHIGHO2_12_FULL_45_10]|uniref:Probable DNA 3'-5' helicase RecG n=1 Tax=Candidatus Woykebacteria bacterium RIFCSPHIGHO2_12_FULL_45_10 TaxID=1802603 RepID=A0A1G1WPH0_9BACT|nr:MAG: hypothetical protein A3F35_02830 [Candidatus Woykebacteria bacterium RIFCSPHIGHO2_12_FULL_45_10]